MKSIQFEIIELLIKFSDKIEFLEHVILSLHLADDWFKKPEKYGLE